jgi:hypothetical protein
MASDYSQCWINLHYFLFLSGICFYVFFTSNPQLWNKPFAGDTLFTILPMLSINLCFGLYFKSIDSLHSIQQRLIPVHVEPIHNFWLQSRTQVYLINDKHWVPIHNSNANKLMVVPSLPFCQCCQLICALGCIVNQSIPLLQQWQVIPVDVEPNSQFLVSVQDLSLSDQW